MARKYEETDTGLLIPSVDLAMVDDVFSEVTARKERERLSKRTVLKKRDGAKIPDDLRSEDDDKISSSFARVNELETELEASGDLAGNAEFLKEYDAATAAYDKLLESVFASDIARVADLSFDDSMLPRADNIYEFVTSSYYLNENPYIVQILYLIQFFEEYCPDCSDTELFTDYAVDDPHEIVLDRLCLLENGVCPRCQKTKTDFYKSGAFRFHEEMVLLIGQRAGKSFITTHSGAYTLHHYLKLPSPTRSLGLSGATQLSGSCVAMKMAQGQSALFGPMRNYVLTSTWFQEYLHLAKMHEKKTGKKMCAVSEQLMRFAHKNVIFQLEAAHQGNLRGRTRIFGAVDEIGHMALEGVQGGPLVHDAVNRSLRTVRGAARTKLRAGAYDMLNGIQCTVSSPKSQRDTINTLYRSAISNPRIFARKAATWDVNPTLPRSEFNADYAKDPIQSECDYGANAPASSDPFIPRLEMLQPSIQLKGMKVVPHKQYTIKQNGVDYTVAKFINPPGKSGNPLLNLPKARFNTLFSFDAGYVNNSFALSIFRLRPGEGGSYFKQLITLFEIIPSALFPINYSHLFDNFVYPLGHAFNCVYAVADRWQSIKFLQDMQAELGCTIDTYSMRSPDFVNVRAQLYSGDIALPDCGVPLKEVKDINVDGYPNCFLSDTLKHFYYQCATVRNGAKNVDKGEGLTDDLFRAFCVGAYYLDQAEVVDALLDESTVPKDDFKPLVASYSGNTSSASSSMSRQDSRGAPIIVSSFRR